MKKPLTIQIPSPCSEKWENFLPTDKGGFCQSCCKTVVDFTRMSEREIREFFSKPSGNTCGRFRADQLKTYPAMQSVNLNPGFALFKAGLFSLLLLLMSRPSSAQVVKDGPKTEIVRVPQEIMGKTAVALDYLIKGVVRAEEDKLPLPGVNIYLKGTQIGTNTDSEGHFEFPRRLKEGDILVFSFIGFVTQEYLIRKEGLDVVEVNLQMENDITGEVIVVGGVCARQSRVRGWWQKVKGLF